MSPDNLDRNNGIDPPTAFPASGVYGVTQLVTLLCATPGATIHYTTDGSLPTSASPIFDPNRLIPTADHDGQEGQSTHLIRAVAVLAGRSSEVAAFEYRIERRGRGEYVSYEAAPGVRTICDFDDDKMYLILGSQKALLVDAGLGNGDLRGYVESFAGGLPLEVVITHGHPDHIAKMGQFQQDRDVYMNLVDLPRVESFVERFHFDIDLARIKDLREGFVFDLGDRRFRVYEVPGHSLGSIVLLDEANGDLFAGDAVGSNRPTIVDALWMQMDGMLLIDQYLSSLQVFRAKTAGQVKAIYSGHNDRPLNGDAYLDQLERAVQLLVDRGVEVLTPSLRPTGVWQVAVGDRLTDPDWIAINVNRDKFLTAEPDRIATLSNLEVRGARLNERFSPSRFSYTAQAAREASQVEIVPTATSSRYRAMTMNGAEASSRRPHPGSLAGEASTFEVAVTSPDGGAHQTYTRLVRRG
jgi:glyoxylase-like metal-dependent hydrolase (beta-lactamase superfamily II)